MLDNRNRFFIILLLLALTFSVFTVFVYSGNVPSVSAKSAALYEPSTKSFLYTKNENQRLPMASTTKIMTALLAIENLDPEEIIDVYYNPKISEALFIIPFDYELSDTKKEQGFISVEKTEDGNALYKIKRKDYEAFISNFCATKKQNIDNNAVEPIKSITYNDDLTEIVIAVDRVDYEAKDYSGGSNYLKIRNAKDGCGWEASLYLAYTTDQFKECVVTVVDYQTGEVLDSVIQPKTLLENKTW